MATPEFADVFRAHLPYAWRCLRRLGVAQGDVDDICQEVFVVVHRKLDAYDGRVAVRSWIYGICVRKASDYRRLARKQHETVMENVPETYSTENPHATLEEKRALQRMDRALNELDEDKRVAFVLYDIEGLPLAEMAEALECPIPTLHSRVAAARKAIQAALSTPNTEEIYA